MEALRTAPAHAFSTHKKNRCVQTGGLILHTHTKNRCLQTGGLVLRTHTKNICLQTVDQPCTSILRVKMKRSQDEKNTKNASCCEHHSCTCFLVYYNKLFTWPSFPFPTAFNLNPHRDTHTHTYTHTHTLTHTHALYPTGPDPPSPSPPTLLHPTTPHTPPTVYSKLYSNAAAAPDSPQQNSVTSTPCGSSRPQSSPNVYFPNAALGSGLPPLSTSVFPPRAGSSENLRDLRGAVLSHHSRSPSKLQLQLERLRAEMQHKQDASNVSDSM
jgi:hypothetical protein